MLQIGAVSVPRRDLIQRAVPVTVGQRAGRTGGPAAGTPAPHATGHGGAAAALQGTYAVGTRTTSRSRGVVLCWT